MRDICDKCGVQAYFVCKGNGGELHFCRHHFLVNESAIRLWATEIEDHSAVLFEKHHPTAAPDPLVSVADPDEFDEAVPA